MIIDGFFHSPNPPSSLERIWGMKKASPVEQALAFLESLLLKGAMIQITATIYITGKSLSFQLPFALMQKEQKIRAVILFLETLENTTAPYPNSQTVLAEAELPIPELRHGCGGLPFISEFLRE